MIALAAARASASPEGDRLTLGYYAARPIAGTAGGIGHTITARWDRAWLNGLELGVGLEVGFSVGSEPLARATLLPGIAKIFELGGLQARIEAAAGPQIVGGRVTLDAIPLQGIEARSFHVEVAGGLDAPLTDRLDLRARLGATMDGLYPAGHASTRLSPFVGVGVVLRL